jgi:hypothetical protein
LPLVLGAIARATRIPAGALMIRRA